MDLNIVQSLEEYITEHPLTTDSIKDKMIAYCENANPNNNVYNIMRGCLSAVKYDSTKDDYVKATRIISNYYTAYKQDIIDTIMENVFDAYVAPVSEHFKRMREVNGISKDDYEMVDAVIRESVAEEYYPKITDAEMSISQFMGNEEELQKFYGTPQMNYLGDNEENYNACCSGYDRAREEYEDAITEAVKEKYFGKKLEQFYEAAKDTPVEAYFADMMFAKKQLVKEAVKDKYDIKPFPDTYYMDTFYTEATDVHTVQKYLTGFEHMPAYPINGVKAVSQTSDAWKKVHKAILDYMNMANEDAVAVGRLKPNTEKKRVRGYVKDKKTDQNEKTDTNELNLSEDDMNALVTIQKFHWNGEPFFASVFIGELDSSCKCWMIYADTIVKKHVNYYTAYVLNNKNLSSSIVEKWAETFLKDYPKLVKEGKEYQDAYTGIKEEYHVGNMLPQTPITGSPVDRTLPAQMAQPIDDVDDDDNPRNWVELPAHVYQKGKAEPIIQAAGIDKVQEIVQDTIRMKENLPAVNEPLQEDEIEEAVAQLENTLRFAVENVSMFTEKTNTFSDEGMDVINYYFENCYDDDCGDFLDVFEYTTMKAVDYYTPKEKPLSIFDVYDEAANIDSDMEGIIQVLNKKGYKTKYSCAGHEKSDKKEDKDKDGVYYGKLYTTARVVFADTYEFKNTPKYWYFKDKLEKDGKTGLYVKPFSHDKSEKGTTGHGAFESWKKKYMDALRSWVASLPEETDSEKKNVVGAKLGDHATPERDIRPTDDIYDDVKIGSKKTNKKEEKKNKERLEKFEEAVELIFSGKNPYDVFTE